MIKSIFVGLSLPCENYKGLGKVGANHLIIAGHFLDKNKWQWLRKLGTRLGISIDCFGKDGCPSNAEAYEMLRRKVRVALKFKPDEIWLDHFRFDGHWESARNGQIPQIHTVCQFCRGKDRVRVIKNSSEGVKKIIGEETKIGYFAVPLTKSEFPQIVSSLGQDHSVIGKIFDMASPMLYHRMINKQTVYISEYVKYLSKLTAKPVLPIIQIKDMPDDLPDKLKAKEFYKAAEEAIKPLSIGVSIFVWEHAIEKHKVDFIKNIFL